MEPLILFAIFICFFTTYLTMPFWIRKARQIDFVWADMNKVGFPKKSAGSGGLIVLFGTTIGILIYIAINIFIFKSGGDILIPMFALLAVLFFSALVGLIDDFFGWQRGGLSARSRIILMLFAAIPLMVINAGSSNVVLPFFGLIELGIWYPLVFIPLGVVGATTTYNFLAGYNGLEAGQGIIILTALAIVTYLTGNAWLSIVALCMVASLFGFYIFNKCPGEVFPGDVLTYSVGAMIAGIAILGNIEKIAILFFIPYIIETILKSRGKLRKHSFAKVNPDGSLEMPYKKIYGLEHLAIKILKKIKSSGKVYEKDVGYLIHGFQLIIILLVFLTMIF
jgi:UDP-N-acetylglucosamine--dolichyl-phosphate N-acetylglucosaminephosphotransferase